MSPLGADNVQRILLVRPSALGDVCRTVPVLSALRAHWPHAHIDWLIQEGFEGAIEHHPAFRHNATSGGGSLIRFPRGRFGRWWSPAAMSELTHWLLDLRHTGYDVVVDAQGLARSSFFAWVTGAGRRVGYARTDSSELAFLGVNERVPAPRTLHAVDRMMALAEHLGAPPARDMRLYPGPDGRRFASERVARHFPRFVVFAPTSRWAGKQWPAERYAELARGLLGDPSLGVNAIAIVGAAAEAGSVRELIDFAAREERVLNLIGLTTIPNLLGVIEQASLVVANDSATLHMAVGLERPIVALFGPTRVDRVGPYGRERDVIQHLEPGDDLDHKDARAGRRLMERISVEEVLEACAAHLRPR